MNKSFAVILATVTLDAVGLGIVLPILPALLREVTGREVVAEQYGLFISLYALMQFIFSPILGSLSDRFGRRPVLLVSLAGASIDYLALAFAPTLSLIFVGRIVAGITGANLAVATAYITDITPESRRAQRFGSMQACFGVGFIVGPVLGGLLGQLSPRYPFLAAAALNAINLSIGYFVLPESRPPGAKKVELKHLNPLRPLRNIWVLTGVSALITIYVVMSMAGQTPMALWVIYCERKFGWETFMIGLSFAVFGMLHALAQWLLTGPLTARLGEYRTIVVGILADVFGFVMMAFATEGWMVFPIIPFLCLGGIAMPALQALLSQRVSEERQGELQGTLVSLTSLVSIFGPLFVTGVYERTFDPRIGYVWIVGAALYVASVPALWRLRRGTRAAPPDTQQAEPTREGAVTTG